MKEGQRVKSEVPTTSDAGRVNQGGTTGEGYNERDSTIEALAGTVLRCLSSERAPSFRDPKKKEEREGQGGERRGGRDDVWEDLGKERVLTKDLGFFLKRN